MKKFKVKKKVFKKKNPKTSPFWKENWPPPCKTHSSDVCCPNCHPDMWNPTREQAVLFSTEALSLQIREAKKAYYAGKPIMRDEEFDALEGSLRAINPNAPILQKVGS